MEQNAFIQAHISIEFDSQTFCVYLQTTRDIFHRHAVVEHLNEV